MTTIITKNFTLFVGSNDQALADTALRHDPTAYLIDSNNYQLDHNGTGYTSIPDLPDIDKFLLVCRQADNIIYSPPIAWNNDNKKYKGFLTNNPSEQHLVEKILQNLSLNRYKPIITNCPEITAWEPITDKQIEAMTELADIRKIDGPQLWAVGCSFTYGVGVKIKQRYANLLADEINMPLSVLADVGTSIGWAGSQILRSDIRKDDIVVWGLTQNHRLAYYDAKQCRLIHLSGAYYSWNPKFNKVFNIDNLTSDNRLYEAILMIHQVINFCTIIGAKLIIAGLLPEPNLSAYLKNKYNNYIHLTNDGLHRTYIDYAENGQHPGPISHKWYSDNIVQLIKEMGYI